MEPRELYDQRLQELIEEAVSHDLSSDDFANASKNLRIFSECRTLLPEPEPAPDPVPVTTWERFKAGAAVLWDNETTRTIIKAGGAFASVGLVTYTTIHRDHVIERQAIAQANQRNS